MEVHTVNISLNEDELRRRCYSVAAQVMIKIEHLPKTTAEVVSMLAGAIEAGIKIGIDLAERQETDEQGRPGPSVANKIPV